MNNGLVTRAKGEGKTTGVAHIIVADLDRPLWVVWKDRNVQFDHDVPGVFDAEVHVNLLPAIDRKVG